MANLALYLLGVSRIQLDEEYIEVKPRKALALLVYLAVTAKHHSRDTLATLLWPDSDQRNARQALSNRLSELNRALEFNWLDMDREAVGLKEGYCLDVAQFQQDLANSEPTDLEPLRTTVDLYRDDFLTGFTLSDCPSFDEWQFFQTEGLRQQLASALEKLVAIQSQQGSYDAAIPYARRWLALEPLHEPAHRYLMQLYAWAGRRATALRQFETCRHLLETELGIPPTPETTELYQAIKAKRLPIPSTPIDRRDRVIQPTALIYPQVAHNLPPQATPFIGRDAERAALDHLLADSSRGLITIVGPGGMGKTRLALACAEQQIERARFPNGVFFVSLAPLRSVKHIIPTLAETIGFQLDADGHTRSPKQQVLDHLRQKQMLVILDNFEHLLDGVDIVVDIVQSAPKVKILATSRERLRLQEEQVYPIQGLVFSDWETPEDAATYTAAKLFLQSAQRVQPNFTLVADDLTYLARICRVVEGMPLGIELAAAWVDSLSLGDIATEIQHSLDFLETDVRNVPERHRSIRAIFDTSWQHLSKTEQSFMVQFSIFQGGFTRHAAQEITGVSLRALNTLTNKSLVQYNKVDDRYQIHELLRQYCAGKLAEKPREEMVVRDHHCAYYTARLHQHEAALRSAEQLTRLGQIKAELENFRAAWDWAITQRQTVHLAQALESLGQFYEWYGRYQEGEAAFRAALGIVDETVVPRLCVRLLNWLATFCRHLLQIEEARDLREHSLALLDSPSLSEADTGAERAEALLGLGRAVGYGTIDPQANQAKIALYEQSLTLYESLQDRWGMARVMVAWSMEGRDLQKVETVEQWRQQLQEVDRLGRQCVTLCQESGNQADLANISVSVAYNMFFLGPPDEALTLMETAAELSQTLGLKETLLRATSSYSLGLALSGNYARAQIVNQAATESAQELGNLRYMAETHRTTGWIALAEKRYDESRQNLQASLNGFQAARSQFHYDITIPYLGMAELHLGNMEVAYRYLMAALRLATTNSHANVFIVQGSLYLAALHLIHRGVVERAIEIYSLVSHLWPVGPVHFYHAIVGRYVDDATSSLTAAEVAAAKAHGRELDLWDTAKAVLDEWEECPRRYV